MNRNVFYWQQREVPFEPGESVASALEQAGIPTFGTLQSGQDARYFCGIGACQGCLIQVDGLVREACLTRVIPGMRVSPAGERP